MGEFLARFVLRLVVELGSYYTARLVLPALSFGRIQVDDLMPPGKADQLAPRQRMKGVLVVESHTARLLGTAFWITTLVVGILIWRMFFMGCPSDIVAPDGTCLY